MNFSLIKKDKLNIFLLFLISIYSFYINFHFSNIGTFPIDTFLHFDSSYRVFKNEYPVKDFWIVSGFIIDFIQSFFFKLFGANWNSYIIHSSLINVVISLFTYYFFLQLKIAPLVSFIYTLCFATLAYTISGTPFVDHHATFFLLIGTYMIIYALNKKDKILLWPIIVFLFSLSFLSKQVPVAYAVILQGFLILFLILKEKSFKILLTIFISIVVIALIFCLFLFYLGIEIKLFYTQYIDYPKSIGTDRLLALNKSFESIFNQYKFIIFPIILTFLIKFKKKSFSLRKNINFLIVIALGISLFYHQILTKNQIYIYFMVPIFFSFFHSEMLSQNYKLNNFYSLIIIICLVLITAKYHYRYNENRKFHELNSMLINKSIEANRIDKIFGNLRWINPFFKDIPYEEIQIILKGKEILVRDKKEVMLISHYSFFEAITKKRMNYPNRTFTVDGASYPVKNNKMMNIYKSFFQNILKNKSIKNIYFFKHENISHKIVKDNLKSECFISKENEIFYIYEVRDKCLN